MPYQVYIFKTDGTIEEYIQKKTPTLGEAQKAVEGPIEIIPHFTRYKEHSRGMAFCNEYGKVLVTPLPFNELATKIWWEENLSLSGRPFYKDVLLGNVMYYKKVK